MLAGINWVQCIGDAASGPAAVDAIDTLRPELVFLDIEMPGFSGVEVLRRTTHQPFVVFTTGYSQYAVTAFELGALDYLVKPFGASRLASAMERVKSGLGEPAPVIPRARLADVAWFSADGGDVEAHTATSRHIVHVSLNRIEARLDPATFTRIHRTHIVNFDHVRAFRRAPHGCMVAEMLDGTRLPVSRGRGRAPELRNRGS